MEDKSLALILMTTYNGEKYIREQLDSILNQSYNNWKLIIQDDGSDDDTLQILKQYENIDKRIQILVNNSNKHGAYPNFWSLIMYVKTISAFDYYFFSDQDDIWLSNKLEIMISAAQHMDINNRPLMLYADMEIINDYGMTIYPSINNVMGIGKISGLSLFFTHGFLWGCDLMINRKLFEVVPIVSLEYEHIDIISHDNYYGKFAIMLGEIRFIPKILIKHRRHNKNTTGTYNIDLTIFKALKQFLTKYDNLAAIHARVYNQTLFTLKEMEKMSIESLKIKEIENAIKSGGAKGVLILKKYKVLRKQMTRTIGIYIIFLMGSYKKYLFYK